MPEGLFLNGKNSGLLLADKEKKLSITQATKESYLFSKNSEIEGPISDLFSKKPIFTVVGGSFLQRNVIAKQFDYFTYKNFKRKYNYIDYLKLNEQIIRGNNILVIKVGTGNHLMSRLTQDSSIIDIEDYLKKDRKELLLNEYVLTCIYPNPFNNEKYVLYLDITRTGFLNSYLISRIMQNNNDYSVYTIDSDGVVLEIESGIFDVNWKLQF